MADEIEAEEIGLTTGRRSSPDKRIQVIARMAAKRVWSVEQKMAILDEAFAPGACVSEVAQRHELNTGQLYTWRRLLLDGKLSPQTPASPVFARVAVAASSEMVSLPAPDAMIPPVEPPAPSCGRIEIELRSGIRIRLDDRVKGTALKQVLDVLQER